MARYTKRSRRYYKRKGIWSSRITNFEGQQLAGPSGNFVIYYNLAQNPAQNIDTVSQKYTVKNINLQAQLENESDVEPGSIENLQAFVMFIPQGFIPTGVPGAYADVPYQHPEWILAHRFYGSPTNDSNPGYPPLRLHSRLARKLDTGDRIVLIILGNNVSINSNTLTYRGIVKYVTKAN